MLLPTEGSILLFQIRGINKVTGKLPADMTDLIRMPPIPCQERPLEEWVKRATVSLNREQVAMLLKTQPDQVLIKTIKASLINKPYRRKQTVKSQV